MIRGSNWKWVVIGVGININQVEFSALQPKAVSLKIVTGMEYDVTFLARTLHKMIWDRYKWVGKVSPEEVMEEYNSRLYKRGEELTMKKGKLFLTRLLKRFQWMEI